MSASDDDPIHHLTGPFLPQTPLGFGSLGPNGPKHGALSHTPSQHAPSFLRWAVQPSSAFKLLLVPLVFSTNWELLAPYFSAGVSNPFVHIFLLSGRIPTSSPDDPRYSKDWWDLAFIVYHIIFWSFIRQSLSIYVFQPLARYFGLRRPAKIDRFCEQGYALVYFGCSGLWGYHIMTQLPIYWYRTEAFWIDYPHWDMKPGLKRYYLMQSSYWCQQLIVLVLGLEKPRKDYYELVAHHIITLWLVGWSYLINLSLIGNAVFMSMDIPDTFLALSKILNYIQWDRAKVVALLFFIGVWSYFRHYLNLVILWSVWNEYDLIPESSKRWVWSEGVYLLSWMKYQVFAPLFLLQLLNLFWYYLILRILWRAITTRVADDDRSDDEDEGDVDDEGGDDDDDGDGSDDDEDDEVDEKKN